MTDSDSKATAEAGLRTGADTGSLLIYVPTYNRFDWVVRQMRSLEPQLKSGRSELVIRDNASPDEKYLQLPSMADGAVTTVFRNAINMGIIDNIMRSFADASGHDYMWMLSDDDPVRDDAVARLADARALDGSVDLTVLLFHDHCGRPVIRDLSMRDVAGLLGAAHSINKISNLIWKTSYFAPFVEYGYQYGSFSYCFDATLVAAVQERGTLRCCLMPASEIFGPEEHCVDHPPMQYVDSLFGYIWLADLMTDERARAEFVNTWAHSGLAELAARRAFEYPHRFWWAAGYLMGESPRLATHLLSRALLHHTVLDRELNLGLRTKWRDVTGRQRGRSRRG